MYKDVGVCAMYSYEDEALQTEKISLLNKQPSEVFTNAIFEPDNADNV